MISEEFFGSSPAVRCTGMVSKYQDAVSPPRTYRYGLRSLALFILA